MNDIFKRKFNDTPLQYLQKIRINHAKELLLQSDQDIVSICFEVGYETLSTFYRTFRNLVGISPNKFRMSGQSQPDLTDTVS
jgi:AraC-like DNA-binding protein